MNEVTAKWCPRKGGGSKHITQFFGNGFQCAEPMPPKTPKAAQRIMDKPESPYGDPSGGYAHAGGSFLPERWFTQTPAAEGSVRLLWTWICDQHSKLQCNAMAVDCCTVVPEAMQDTCV